MGGQPQRRVAQIAAGEPYLSERKGSSDRGGSAYPELVPPTGKVLAEVTLIASGKIEQCEAYAGPGR
jgi:hypothetical protein